MGTDNNDTYIDMEWAALFAMGVVAFVAIFGFFGLLASSNKSEQLDCMPACVIEDVQYMPQRINGECWCNMKKARALTD